MCFGWELIKSYYKDNTIIQQNIESYNQFIFVKVPQIIQENSSILSRVEDVEVRLNNVQILRPQLVEEDGSRRTDFFPMEARLRDKTYSAPIFADIELYRKGVLQDTKRTAIGELPVMVKSKLCNLCGLNDDELIIAGEDPKDLGSYFVINGVEKVLVNQEVLASDKIMVSRDGSKCVSEVLSTRGAFKGKVRLVRNPNGILEISFPSSPKKLKFFVLLRALCFKTKEDFTNTFENISEIQNDVLLNFSRLNIESEEEALDQIGKYVAPGQILAYRLKRTYEILDNFLLPHIGQTEDKRILKAYYLIGMAQRAIELAYNLRDEDDKDSYNNKRIELSGKLLERQFMQAINYFINDIKFQIDRNIVRRRRLKINTIIRPDVVTDRIMFGMATGIWAGKLTGVSSFFTRYNWLNPIIEARKVKSTLDSSRENYEARSVHGTAWGRVCPIETPDGPNCGLIKNLAVMSRVTTDYEGSDLDSLLRKLNVSEK